MGTPTTVGVDDNLAASETSITVGATDDEATRGVKVEDGLVIEVLLGNNGLDNVLHEVLTDLLIGDIRVMLGRDEDGMNADGDHSTTLTLVLDGDLGLAVGTEPGASSVLADLGKLVAKLGGENVGEGHELRGLISGIAEHVALVASTDLLKRLGAHTMNTLANIRGLLLDEDKDLALVTIETNILRGEADLLASLADNGLVINLGGSGNLTENHHHVGLGAGLASNLGIRILGKDGIKNSVGHLVTKLIRMALVDRL
mmetsp:Transcript_2115/g.3182  ORF Transcript_2115/g.3182 Transcript_2115/m.3182 type:complete len:258 (-) Transcript_2115:342-1115(-)